jgi:hypothetical protein
MLGQSSSNPSTVDPKPSLDSNSIKFTAFRLIPLLENTAATAFGSGPAAPGGWGQASRQPAGNRHDRAATLAIACPCRTAVFPSAIPYAISPMHASARQRLRHAVSRSRHSPWLGFALVAIAYAIVATWHITLPGVYMDEVNPDYLVVKILNPRHAPIVAWVLQGNYVLGDRVPILAQLYHGSQTFWLGLPLFWIFGTSVQGLRLTHAMFAVGVLAALYAVLLRARMRPWQAAAACLALAIDPSFSYAFRTQSYITLASDAWLLLAVRCLLPSHERSTQTPRPLFWSGFWTGAAIVGYFVHAFYVPALAIGVSWVTRGHEGRLRWRKRFAWIAGLAVGASPYLLGYALIMRNVDGLSGLWAFIESRQATLHTYDSSLPLPARLAFAWRMIVAVVSDAWHHAMMFGEWAEVPATYVKLALLVAVPLLLWIAAAIRRHASLAQSLLVGLPVSFVVLSLPFGDRLGGHHFVTLLPIFYAALAVGLSRLFGLPIRRSARARAGWCLPFLALVAINATGQAAESRDLLATRGVGLMSDAIDRFAADINASARKPWFFFPDWGLSLPVAFLTRGTVGMSANDDAASARSMLCAGRDVAIALVDGDRAARRDDWTRRLGWTSPGVTSYRQGNGTIVFEVVTYRGNPNGPGCVTR